MSKSRSSCSQRLIMKTQHWQQRRKVSQASREDGVMTPEQRAFHMKEYETLRQEVSVLLARIENLFKYSFVASATVFAWLLSNSVGLTKDADLCLKLHANLQLYAWVIPAAFSYLALGLAWVNNERAQKTGRYLRQLESRLGSSDLGWEAFSQKGAPVMTLAAGMMWIVLIVASTWAAIQIREAVQKAQEQKVVCTKD